MQYRPSYFRHKEQRMKKKDSEETDDLDALAELAGLQYPIRLSPELSELLEPNEFLAGLGIRFSDRINAILSILKGSLIPINPGQKETLPKGGIVIPILIARGPYIREEMVSIKAELTDDGGKAKMLLTAILETE
jgi:hypothetical protein